MGLKFRERNMSRRFVIGDVHGNYQTLKSLIGKLGILPDDQLFFLGDYINKGPESKKVIDYIIELANDTNVTCLKGNHEQMYEELKGDPYSLKGKDGLFELKYRRFWDGLKYYVELEDAFLVHASINFKAKEPFQDITSMLWKAHRSMYNPILAGKRIIRGHSTKTITEITESVKNKEQVIALDNAAERNNQFYRYLCALELNNLELIVEEWQDGLVQIDQYGHELYPNGYYK